MKNIKKFLVVIACLCLFICMGSSHNTTSTTPMARGILYNDVVED